ncbi:hypothetical protein K6119_04740 [Paracrocinitomix mangrovi]|uniref:hypothetical protein n=1 Tax=Paracrocinitomix mangrovi TaxID=2862509 RepID=UPI001C8DE6D8|nr:hypothetical protein [Paracrocinitomix mangrovi]UKN02823.1 hypothetical protein K6119_04740 [Paracrocinitomix mangrovi]
MKKLLLFFAVALITFGAKSQECDSLVNVCYTYLAKDSKKGKVFISDGQVYQAFVDAEQSAEFKVTLYGGSLYRIATTAGTKDNYVIFNVYDQDRNLLFSNADHDNAPYWDFKVDNTLDCYVEAYLDIDKKVSGCLVLLIGFNK